jgi:hypothetical protein
MESVTSQQVTGQDRATKILLKSTNQKIGVGKKLEAICNS